METIPNINKLKKYTLIDVIGTSADKAQQMFVKEFQQSMKFVPPLFKEYVIRVDNTDIFKLAIIDAIENGTLHISKDDKVINDFIQQQPENIHYHYFLVRWQSPTQFSITVYGEGKKRLYILVDYTYDDDDKPSLEFDVEVLSAEYKREYENHPEKINQIITGDTLMVMGISDYLLNYSNKVQYIEEIKSQSKSSSSRKPSVKEYKQNNTIYLKSKIKRYEIDSTEIEKYKKRTYQKIKNSWYVRGYYQRFGKDKIPQFIPPRINRRNQEIIDTPQAPTYKLELQEE